MAKDDDQVIMSPAEMKPLLMLSKREPVNCAIGLSKDKEAMILLDKKAKPRKVFAMLKKAAAGKNINLDMATVRFGTASVDTAVDSALVQFKVNKDPPGTLRPKLIATLKKAGFGKCEIIVDQGLEDEPEDEPSDESKTDAEPAAATAASPDAAAGTPPPAAAEPVAASADQAPDQPPAGQADDGKADAAAMTQRLTGLVKRMLGVLASNPAGADAMKTAAMAAQTALKSGDVDAATAEAATLERLLDAAPPAGAAAGPGAAKAGPAMGSPVFAKAQATWVATRKKVENELEKLHDELQSVYKGHGVVADLEKTFRSKVEPMMAAFDHSLSDKLDEVAKNADPATHAKLVAEVKAIIGKYEDFLGSDPLIAKLDDNPFVPLALEKTLTASLTALSKVVA